MGAEPTRYRMGAWTLASEIPLPELPRTVAPVDWTIRVAHTRRPEATRPYHRWRTPEGTQWLSFSRHGSDHLLRVARRAWFRVSPGERSITWERPHLADRPTLRHLLLNQIVPLALSVHHGVLHASAVVLPQGALILAGGGGAGKSTLAAALNALGHPLLADDAVVIERDEGQWCAMAGACDFRLWPEAARAVGDVAGPAVRVASYTRKLRLRAGRVAEARRTPLAGVCLLDPRPLPAGAAPLAETLDPRAALVGLVPYLLRLDVADRLATVRALDLLAGIVGAVPVWRLRLDRRLAVVRDQAGALAGVVASVSGVNLLAPA